MNGEKPSEPEPIEEQPREELPEQKSEQKPEVVSETEKLEKELFAREIPPEYKELIKKVNLITRQDAYSKNFIFKIGSFKILQDILGEKIKDGTVLDLGCGRSFKMGKVSRNFGAKIYIGVDLFPTFDLDGLRDLLTKEAELSEDLKVYAKKITSKQMEQGNLEITSDYFDKESGSRALRVAGDMLGATARLADNSISVVTIFGIQTHSGGKEQMRNNSDYITALEKEILRVLKSGGIVINYESDIGFSDYPEIKIKYKPEHSSEYTIYEKMAEK